MEPKKTRVTIVGAAYAHPGAEFIYMGRIEACESCSISRVCHNLETGRRYEVVAIRAASHTCPVHLKGSVTVDVTEASIEMNIPVQMAKKNTTILVRLPECDETCEWYADCHPAGIVHGQKYIITDIIREDPISCREGTPRVMVRVIPLPGGLPRASS
jgi:uncharacterized protein (UPF0179 family)